jgi:iron complex outermembrane recepter protein
MSFESARNSPSSWWRHLLLSLILSCASQPVLRAAEPEPDLRLGDATIPTDYTDLSLDELMSIQVTSVSKRPEPLSTAAAAITVLTRDDIRRSGATNIPDLLRQVPGVHVARLDSGNYAISVRGFNDIYANKLLVLRDGRSLYTPLYSGVYWQFDDPMMEDIERIEVIRGPGGTLWGANAVNGVINIITRSARDSQGGLLTLGAGLEQQGLVGLRYGGQLSADTWFKIYGTAQSLDGGLTTTGGHAGDDLANGSIGFLLEKEMGGTDILTLQADAYRSQHQSTIRWPVLNGVTNVLTDETLKYQGEALRLGWLRHLGDGEHLSFKLYYDYTDGDNPLLGEKLHQLSAEFEHAIVLGSDHVVVWGLGARYYHDEAVPGPVLTLSNLTEEWGVYSGFVQDEITLIPERLKLTVGTKVEYQEFTGMEWQPSLRLAFTPYEHQTWWAAVSRAVRTPSRINRGLVGTFAATQFPPPIGLRRGIVYGNEDFESENLIAWELGYRARVSPALTIETALFYNQYDQLLTVEPVGSPLRVKQVNNGYGESYGGELSIAWQVQEGWRMNFTYSYEQLDLHQHPGPNDAQFETREGLSPRQQVGWRNSFDLNREWELDLGLRLVDSMPELNVPGYLAADVRLGWRPRPNLCWDLVVQHAGSTPRQEYEATEFNRFIQASEIETSVFARLTYAF